MSALFRAPMRSRRADIPEGIAVERALRHALCGFGGVLAPPPTSVAEAVERASTQHDDRLAARIARFADAPEGALVWTRDVDGLFWLGRLGGPWRYDDGEAAREADLTHVRPCEWLSAPVGEPAVPARVQLAFARGGKNWQGIRSDSALDATIDIWAERMPAS